MSRHRQVNKQTKHISRNHARVADLFTTKRCGLLLLLVIGILARPAWQVLQSYGLIKTNETQLRQMINLEGSIMYRDEVLTMSANMAAATAEMKWADRYAEFGQRTKPEVEKNWSISENKDIGEEAILAGFASDKLTKMENEAFELVQKGKQNEAMALLQSQEYRDQKDAYNRGMKTFVSRVRSTLEDQRDKYWTKVRNVSMAMGGILPIIILVWLIAIRAGEHIYNHATTNHKISSFAREWQETFNAISDGVCIIDRNGGKILQCNKAMTKFLKRPYNEIIGQSCCELLHGSSEPVKKCPLMRMLGTRRSETMDFQAGDRWLNIKVDPLIDNKGHLVGAVHILSDITEHRKAIKALRESENKFRLAFANAQDAIIWIEGETGVITNCNKSAEELFGKGKKEILGQHHTTLYPEDKAEHHQSLFSEFRRDTNSNIEAEIVRRGGEIRTVTIALSTMFVEGKEIIQGIIRDITQSREAEKEKTELVLQLGQKQKMEAIGTLAGGIAHDFNNILAAMQGYAELTLDDLPENSPVRGNLEQIMSCTNRATKLVKQILTFSRKDQKEQEKEPLQISSIVKEVLSMLRSSLPTAIRISRKIHAESSTVLADPTQIHQVLLNLCTNALHAMREKGGLLEVSLSDANFESETRIGDEYLDRGSYVKLSVSDSGCGMEKEVLERIFEPFFTTKNVDEGTGLGLSVVHGIIKSHDGAITVSSTPGEGTVFDIYLPRIEGGEASEPQSPKSAPREKDVILLVDDEEMMVDVTRQILERLGFDVVAKTNSIDALETFQEQSDQFDLVITNQVMPNMTGTELARNLISIRPDIPVILCSGFPESICHEELSNIGVKEFVMKPISREKIAAIVQKVLDENKVTT
jgi:PAS domain S-box-containing protein